MVYSADTRWKSDVLNVEIGISWMKRLRGEDGWKHGPTVPADFSTASTFGERSSDECLMCASVFSGTHQPSITPDTQSPLSRFILSMEELEFLLSHKKTIWHINWNPFWPGMRFPRWVWIGRDKMPPIMTVWHFRAARWRRVQFRSNDRISIKLGALLLQPADWHLQIQPDQYKTGCTSSTGTCHNSNHPPLTKYTPKFTITNTTKIQSV